MSDFAKTEAGETESAATLPGAGGGVATEPRVAAPAGYSTGELLGQGGMGEVVLAHDERIGRDVALKRMRAHAPSDDALARFLREARIQARLEHPAIVPVYDLGHDAAGAPYFTMKRLAGVTLLGKLDEPRDALGRQALLRAFVDVCRAIDYAHTRGVVHRDLKPSNIMLGDFGEVYVLDWGVARVLGTARDAADSVHALATTDIDTLDSQTQAGAVLGTPGYMPPEQLAGGEVTPAADVYALGSMLFELLTGESLHPRGTGAMASTLSAPTASPAQRTPALAIPPELDAACTTALAEKPEGRPTARELANRVQRYLDGDRDGERRRALAEIELAAARDAVDSGDPARRADAMAAAGRALALDPTSKPAAELVSSLLLSPPDKIPAELEAELAETDRATAVRTARVTTYSVFAMLAFVPSLWLIPVASWTTAGLLVGGTICMALLARRMVTTGRARVLRFMVLWDLYLIALYRVFGPWVLAPAMIAVSSASMIALPQLVKRPVLVVCTAMVTMLAPVALEWTGVLSPTWSVHDGVIASTSGLYHLGPVSGPVIVILTHVAMMTFNVLIAWWVARTSRAAHHRAEMVAWHLRKLVPSSDRPAPR